MTGDCPATNGSGSHTSTSAPEARSRAARMLLQAGLVPRRLAGLPGSGVAGDELAQQPDQLVATCADALEDALFGVGLLIHRSPFDAGS